MVLHVGGCGDALECVCAHPYTHIHIYIHMYWENVLLTLLWVINELLSVHYREHGQAAQGTSVKKGNSSQQERNVVENVSLSLVVPTRFRAENPCTQSR